MWSSIGAVLYDGRLDERKVMREDLLGEGKFNVLITHYDLIMRDKAFLKKIHWYYMIVDEGHRLKNHESVLARTLVSGYDFPCFLQCFIMYILYQFYFFLIVKYK